MKVARELYLHDIFILAHVPLFIRDLSKPKEKHIQGKTTSCLCDSVNKYAIKFQIFFVFLPHSRGNCSRVYDSFFRMLVSLEVVYLCAAANPFGKGDPEELAEQG